MISRAVVNDDILMFTLIFSYVYNVKSVHTIVLRSAHIVRKTEDCHKIVLRFFKDRVPGLGDSYVIQPGNGVYLFYSCCNSHLT